MICMASIVTSPPVLFVKLNSNAFPLTEREPAVIAVQSGSPIGVLVGVDVEVGVNVEVDVPVRVAVGVAVELAIVIGVSEGGTGVGGARVAVFAGGLAGGLVGTGTLVFMGGDVLIGTLEAVRVGFWVGVHVDIEKGVLVANLGNCVLVGINVNVGTFVNVGTRVGVMPSLFSIIC
jgi:hypothetical protein